MSEKPISTHSKFYCAECGTEATSSTGKPPGWVDLHFQGKPQMFFCGEEACKAKCGTLTTDEAQRNPWFRNKSGYTGKVDYETYECSGCKGQHTRCTGPISHSVAAGGDHPWARWMSVTHQGTKVAEQKLFCPACVERILSLFSQSTT